MRIWTVHTPPEAARPARSGSVPAAGPAPGDRVVLVREGFALWAFLLPLPWLLWHRLWLAALGYLGLSLAIGTALPGGAATAAGLALHLLVGLHGQDLRRRALARRGLVLAHVVAERSLDSATARLLRERPDLAAPLARAALA